MHKGERLEPLQALQNLYDGYAPPVGHRMHELAPRISPRPARSIQHTFRQLEGAMRSRRCIASGLLQAARINN